MTSIAIYLGTTMLAAGICSPALGSVNNHAVTLVFMGLALVVTALYVDHRADKKERA